MDMQIRKSTEKDLFTMQKIYTYARALMRQTGNPNQWKDNRPPIDAILNDVLNGDSYVIENDGEVIGVFSFVIGPDPTYAIIEEGRWLDDESTYGVIHKVASTGKEKGVMDTILSFCFDQISNIRIDTHADNKIMQHVLLKNGFSKCGIIYVDDGSPRIAYQKLI